jgi:GNAT superfamily N-acetyltransferase
MESFHMNVEIRNLTANNVDDALIVCTPEKLTPSWNPFYSQGLKVRKEWLLSLLDKVGSCCKIAYVDKKPAGMIQFSPIHRIPYLAVRRRDALYIHCIFVKHKFRNQGIGSQLLKALIDEMKKPNPLFENKPCQVFVTTARERHGFKQPSYFRLKGFSRIAGDPNLGLLYRLSEKAIETLDVPCKSPVQVEEKGVKIFYDSSCQYCIYFNESTKALIKEVKPDVPIVELNLWNKPEEALKRCVTGRVTYVNGTPIIFQRPTQFREAIIRALQA